MQQKKVFDTEKQDYENFIQKTIKTQIENAFLKRGFEAVDIIRLEGKPSYKSLGQYMKGYKAHFGIFLVFDNKKRTKRSEKWETRFEKIRNAYQLIDNETVLGLKCIQV
ncbi:MAG: hypothetical protein JRF53_10235 [Deltaproteobacteria bacterium]|nr:hypothetical protein [Deltaproteobacteria bacterium]